MRQTPGQADGAPQGSGPPNRHGMPKLPVGQTQTAPGKWPVLDLGLSPIVPYHRWQLTLDGACRHPQTLDWDAFLRLEQIDDVSDFHCVTGWSRLDVPWHCIYVETPQAQRVTDADRRRQRPQRMKLAHDFHAVADREDVHRLVACAEAQQRAAGIAQHLQLGDGGDAVAESPCASAAIAMLT